MFSIIIPTFNNLKYLKEEIDLSIGFNIMKINPLNEFIVGDFSDKNYNIFDFLGDFRNFRTVCVLEYSA